MVCWDSPMRKMRCRPEGGEAAAVAEAEEVALITTGGLRSRTARVSTLASTSPRNTTWYLKNTINLCLQLTLMIIVEVVVAEAAVEAEVVEVVEMTIRKTPARRQPQQTKKNQRTIYRLLKDKTQRKESWLPLSLLSQSIYMNVSNKTSHCL